MEAASATRNSLTEDSLRISTQLHNTYPLDTAMSKIDLSCDGVNELCRIINKFDYQRVMRLRLLHRHLDLLEGQILLEKPIPRGYRSRRTAIGEVDLGQLYGQFYSASAGALWPTEFRCDTDNLVLDVDFILEFAQALVRNHLDKTLGIEVTRDSERRKMVEFSDDSGSILLDEASVDLTTIDTLQCTAWGVTDDGVADQTGEVRCVVMNGAHVKFENSNLDRNVRRISGTG